jgi:hypothetical protein
MNASTNLRIAAVSVNHNTSPYMELMVRSLFARHRADLPLALTIYDNASTDDSSALRAYAAQRDVPLLPSGFALDSEHNSHGDTLRRFVLEQADCSHYLFLDADVCFVEPNTLDRMLVELDTAPDAFGIGPLMSWDGITPLTPEYALTLTPHIYHSRLHPCCALVRNTPLFRSIVAEIGMSCANYLWADRAEYLDTFQLLTKVLRTHGLRHILSSSMVLHFFATSYEWDDEATRQHKMQRRDSLLAALRNQDNA